MFSQPTRNPRFSSEIALCATFAGTNRPKWNFSVNTASNFAPNATALFDRFSREIITKTLKYEMPVIALEKDTPKEAVCRVFENVNTGGASLNVFSAVKEAFLGNAYGVLFPVPTE